MIEADMELEILLRHLVEEARSLVDARYGALGVLDETRAGLEQFLTVGLSEEEAKQIGPRPTGRGVLGLLVTEPAPIRLSDLREHPKSCGFPRYHPPMRSFLGVPVKGRVEVYGDLYLTDKRGADTFSEEDEAMVEALALAANIAIERNRLHERVRRFSLLEDRDRIGRDLHDRVIQRIFVVGMALQGATQLDSRSEIVGQVNKVVDDLDATVAEIRSTIFELGDPRVSAGLRGRRGRIGRRNDAHSRLATRGPLLRTSRQWSSRAHLRSRAGSGARGPDQCGQARAGQSLRRHPDGRRQSGSRGHRRRTGLELTPEPGSRGMGLANLRNRAENLGGSFEIQAAPNGRTCALWRVPLSESRVAGTE